MGNYLRGCSAVLIAVVLILTVSQQRKELALLLSIAACTMIGLSIVGYLKPVIDFARELRSMGNIDPEVFDVLLKAVGIGILSEITVLICNDSGNGSLGKSLQYLTSAVIMYLSLPLFTLLLDLLKKILGEI